MTHITVTDQSSTYFGHFEQFVGIIDGSYGDEDYNVQEHIYTALVWNLV